MLLDPVMLGEITEWAEAVKNLTQEKIGTTHVYLEGARETCRVKECNLGNMITDAYIWVMVTFPDEEKWNEVSIAIQNSGGIRASIAQGNAIGTYHAHGVLFGDTYVKIIVVWVTMSAHQVQAVRGQTVSFKGTYEVGCP